MLKRDVILTHVTHVLLDAGVAEPCQLYLQRIIGVDVKKDTQRRKILRKKERFLMLQAKQWGSISWQVAALVPDAFSLEIQNQGNLAVIRDKYCHVT